LTEPLDLLRALMDVGYVRTPAGRMLHVNDPDRSEAPRMALGTCSQGAVVLYRHDAEDLQEHTTLAAPIAPHNIEYHHILPHDARWSDPTVIAQGTPEGDALWARLRRDGLPPGIVTQGFTDLSHFWPPWCVAMAGDEIVSIAFAARIDAAAACIGVATVPAFRGRGHACAVTAAWSALPALRDRVLFYSTHFDNRASQRVIAKLALPRLGVGLTLP
jgi:hypothetical protein